MRRIAPHGPGRSLSGAAAPTTSERQGFAPTIVFGGTTDEMLAASAAMLPAAEAGTLRPGMHNIPAGMRDREMAATLRKNPKAIHITQVERADLARSVDVRCRDARCEVQVTEALKRCDATEGLMYAHLPPETPPSP